MAFSFRSLLIAAVWVGGGIVTAHGANAAGAVAYDKTVAPLFQKYCLNCHGPKKQKSDVRIDTLNRDFINGPNAEDWHDVLDVLNRGEMPPEDETQLKSKDRQVIVDWITGQLSHAADIKRSTGGRGVLRRLTRYEYNQTMKDLLGVDLDYANDLPPEARSADGFKNNGSAMGMSALQLEYYLAAARLGMSKALVEGDAPEIFRYSTTENQARNNNKPLKAPHTVNIQPGSSFLARLMDYPEEGPVRIRVRVKTQLPEGASKNVTPRMRVTVGVRADTVAPASIVGEDVDVLVRGDAIGVYEFQGRLENFPMPNRISGKYPGLLVNVYNVYDDGSGAIDNLSLSLNKQEAVLNKPDPAQPWLVIQSVEFIGPDYTEWPPAYHRAILFEGEGSGGDETAYARRVLQRFMGRAFRRPARANEVDVMLGYYSKIRPSSDSFVAAIRETLAMVLVSPEFLYLLEAPEENAPQGVRDLTAYEVATRLSYFLWSTMPDAELLAKAANGSLLKPRTLTKQVARMLADDRSDRLVNHFADQWLDLEGLDRVAVNPQFYPDFNDRLKDEMRHETRAFFGEVLREDLSALNFIESDFAMLSPTLAKHYGIEGLTGTGFRRVQLKPEDQRGGLLTHGSMLVGNSTGEDSHPIKRAVWVLERLLNDPPPDPPANVPALDSETPGFAELSLKDQLKVHREEEACISCHLKIDPWGIPLEHYDAAGQFRTEARRLSADMKGRARTKLSAGPVDASDVMPTGQAIDGVAELKTYLLKEKRDEFARAMVVKLMAYGLGRSLEFTDDALVDKLAVGFKRSDYRLGGLIESIVASEAFLTK